MMRSSHYYDLTHELLKKELKVRYKRLTLGYFWSIGSPLMYAGLYWVVFVKIIKMKTENYPLFLVASLFPWQWMMNTINAGPATFVSNASLIKKTLFPRFLIPVVVSFQDAIHYLISVPVVLLLMFFFHGTFSWHWLYAFPFLFLIQFGIALGLNMIFATLSVFFGDIERFLQIGTTFLFYLTPVLYSETLIPEKYQWLILYHPLAPLIINWRNLFMQGTIRMDYLLASFSWTVLILLFARWVYLKLSWRFAEVL